MSKHSGKIGLYLLLIVALIAGYLYLNDQVSTQGSYTMGQLEKALEEDKVTDAVIHQNREVPTGYVTANIVSDGQKTVYVTDALSHGLEALQDRDTARIISVFFCHSTDSFLFMLERLFVLYSKYMYL